MPTRASAEVLLGSGSEVAYEAVYVDSPMRRLAQIAVEPRKNDSFFLPGPDFRPFEAFVKDNSVGRGKTPIGDCRGCRTSVGLPPGKRLGMLRVKANFKSPTTASKFLVVRVKYLDGIVIRIDGQQVAVRNWPAASGELDDMRPAKRPSGSFWETIRVPVAGLSKQKQHTLSAEVRPSPWRDNVVFDFELLAEESPGIIRGPMVQKVTRASATIAFSTAAPATAKVLYGPTPTLGNVAQSADGSFASRHRVDLQGLDGHPSFYYKVVTQSTESKVYNVSLAPGTGDALRFVVYGDMRDGHQTHRKILAALAREQVSFVANTGDLVARGSDEGDWQNFFSMAGELMASVPFYPAIGNHDMGRAGGSGRRMKDIFALWSQPSDTPRWGHWYSFTVSGVHFVMLDSNTYEDPRQLQWLKQDLQQARKRKVRAIFAITHDGPYSRGPHRGNQYAAEHYAPLLAKFKVDMLLSGHDHLYQRGELDGLRYVVSGGGGAPLYPVRCGTSGRRKCRFKDGMKYIEPVHHYIVVTVGSEKFSMCPKEPSGKKVERCRSYMLSGTTY